jgi:hypothetical protein
MRHQAARAASLLLVLVLGCSRDAAEPTGATVKPVATVAQLMDAIVIPSSQSLFDAVVYSNGALVQSPKTDEDWHRVEMQAIAVAEAGNLLMLPPRPKDGGEWMTLSRAMTDAAARASEAARAQDVGRLLMAGGELYETCTACHAKYVPR